MEFLVELGEKVEAENKLQYLKHRKHDLLNTLQTLRSEQYVIDVENEEQTKEDKASQKYYDILQSYRLLGVSIQSTEPVLVLQFDPLYRDQYPTTEYYNVELRPKGDKFELGPHNLPPFVPTKELSHTYLPSNIPEFIRHVQQYLYAYVQRREGVKHVQESFVKRIINQPEVDLTVTYVRLQLSLGTQLPDIDMLLTYNLLKCVPDRVDIQPVDEEAMKISRKRWNQLVTDYTDILSCCDLHAAVSEILQEHS